MSGTGSKRRSRASVREMTEDVWALLEEIKNGRRACIIPVLNDAGSRIGELRPVTVETPDDARRERG